MRLELAAALLSFVFCVPARALAQHPTGDIETDLAKKSQNPVGDLAAVPLQFNFYTGGALSDRTLLDLNLQPVLPLPVTSDVNLILRTIVPYLDIPVPTDPTVDPTPNRASGIGDIQQQFFFTPSAPSDITWGIGPIFSYPLATNDAARTGDWAVGPTGVIVFDIGPFLMGLLASQLWTFAGDDSGENLNFYSAQPFINFNLPEGWAITTAPIITANWAADSDETWTVPLGGGVSKVTAVGEQALSVSLQYYHQIEYQAPQGSELLRIVVSFLFPIKMRR